MCPILSPTATIRITITQVVTQAPIKFTILPSYTPSDSKLSRSTTIIDLVNYQGRGAFDMPQTTLSISYQYFMDWLQNPGSQLPDNEFEMLTSIPACAFVTSLGVSTVTSTHSDNLVFSGTSIFTAPDSIPTGIIGATGQPVALSSINIVSVSLVPTHWPTTISKASIESRLTPLSRTSTDIATGILSISTLSPSVMTVYTLDMSNGTALTIGTSVRTLATTESSNSGDPNKTTYTIFLTTTTTGQPKIGVGSGTTSAATISATTSSTAKLCASKVGLVVVLLGIGVLLALL